MTKARLISLEGTSGRGLAAAARQLLRQSGGRRRGGISAWDASGVFTELAAGDPAEQRPSPRTLTLLYAADLAFRLRWQIQPALAEGRLVVAAPYVETAIALGRAAGLPHAWLVRLFAFAPAPHACFRLRPGRAEGAPGPAAGYVEFYCRELAAAGDRWDIARIVQRAGTCLDAVERRGRCRPFP